MGASEGARTDAAITAGRMKPLAMNLLRWMRSLIHGMKRTIAARHTMGKRQ
jgi:hypothetical protein